MINKIIEFFKPKQWQYIGCTKADAVRCSDDGKLLLVSQLKILYFTCGNSRKIKKIKWGDSTSSLMDWNKADAKAWLKGGDLPKDLKAAQ